MDFAIAVPDWPTILRSREVLLASGLFEARGKALHALTFKNTLPVDLIPFGGILRPDHTIAWPLDRETVMTLVAYSEAWQTSLQVLLPDGQCIQVISIPALAILKRVAWQDHRHTSGGKDADDLEAGQMERFCWFRTCACPE